MNGFTVLAEFDDPLVPDVVRIGEEDDLAAYVRAFRESYQRDLVQRVALRLLALGGEEGEWSSVNQFQICASAGMSRPSANGVLVDLKNEGLIDLGRGRFQILDRAALVKRALAWTTA